jgi:hypothetical protein
MKIKITSKKSLYVTIGEWTYYIDDSTNEQIIDKFLTKPYNNDTKRKGETRKKTASGQKATYNYLHTKKCNK